MLFQFLPHKKVILLWKKYKILLAWLGFEPMISRSEVHHANHYTIEASYKEGQIFHVESYNVLHFCEVKIKMHVVTEDVIKMHHQESVSLIFPIDIKISFKICFRKIRRVEEKLGKGDSILLNHETINFPLCFFFLVKL